MLRTSLRVERSSGRRHAEPSHAYRDDFQRDRDRIIHARSFRRLENKTQVFTRRYSDHFRNRLTHTIEVSQITRTIAGALGLNVDLAETLALVHDIGHPPFGHAGEKALDTAMRVHGESFDHNLHALRTVEYLEQRYAAFRGLNLTFEVREGIIKHSDDHDVLKQPQLAEYMLDKRPPLEAQLIDLTDEIAYTTADMDDGVEARILTREQVREGVPILEHFYQHAKSAYPAAAPKLLFNEALKSMLDRLAGDLLENTAARAAAAGVETVEDVRVHPERLVAFSDEVEEQRAQAKAFLYAQLYFSPQLAPEKQKAEEVITFLFEHWLKTPRQLPPTYQQMALEHSLPRVVCDYIAGMTDNFILEQYTRLSHAKKHAAR